MATVKIDGIMVIADNGFGISRYAGKSAIEFLRGFCCGGPVTVTEDEFIMGGTHRPNDRPVNVKGWTLTVKAKHKTSAWGNRPRIKEA